MDDRPARRRALWVGGAVFVALAALGAPWYVHRVERDVRARVDALVVSSGADGVDVAISGQDVVLRCDGVNAGVDDLAAAARSLRGVRTVDVDATCVGVVAPTDSTEPSADAPSAAAAPSTTDETTAATTAVTVASAPPAPTSTAPATAAPSTTTTTVTTATTTSRATTTTSVARAALDWPRATYADGVLTLEGTVASDEQVLRLAQAADRYLPQSDVVVELDVDPASEVDDLAALAYAELVAVMPRYLVEGVATMSRTGPVITGTPIDDDARESIEATAQVIDARTSLEDAP